MVESHATQANTQLVLMAGSRNPIVFAASYFAIAEDGDFGGGGPPSVDSDSFAERAAGAKKKCWEGLDRIFRKFVDLWTLRMHQGRFVPAS